MHRNSRMDKYIEWLVAIIGGGIGWIIGQFQPTFPPILVVIAFIIYDSWTAFELEVRVKKVFPEKKKRPAKYVSYKAWGMIPTMIESCVLILLMYAVQKWVFVDFYVPLSYVATGVICAIQLLSIAENKCSCRLPSDTNYKVWKVLATVLIDKTERHFDTDLSELKEELNNNEV